VGVQGPGVRLFFGVGARKPDAQSGEKGENRGGLLKKAKGKFTTGIEPQATVFLRLELTTQLFFVENFQKIRLI
jgi:hypothetical protein